MTFSSQIPSIFIPLMYFFLQSKNAKDRGKRGMTRIAVTNYYVNTIVTALQSSEWERLLKRYDLDEPSLIRRLTSLLAGWAKT